MTISAKDITVLNNFSQSLNAEVSLGTLVQNAESVAASEIALTTGSGLIGVAGVATAIDLKGDGKILVGNGTTATSVAVSGDVTLSNAGVVAIGAAKVTKAMLASTVRPSHMVVFAGTFTTAGGDAAEQITVTGAVAATDICFVQLHTKGGTPRTILTAAVDTDAINLEFSGDPSTDHVVKYQVLRATS